jgi:hypothetical protein
MVHQEQELIIRYRLHSKRGFGITWTGSYDQQELGVRAIRNKTRAITGRDPLVQHGPVLKGNGAIYIWPDGSYVTGLRARLNIVREIAKKDPIIFKRTMVPMLESHEELSKTYK